MTLNTYEEFGVFLESNQCRLFNSSVTFADECCENEIIVSIFNLVAGRYDEFRRIAERELRTYFDNVEEDHDGKPFDIETAIDYAEVNTGLGEAMEWSFIVGISSIGGNFGCHLEFVEDKFKMIWGGD